MVIIFTKFSPKNLARKLWRITIWFFLAISLLSPSRPFAATIECNLFFKQLLGKENLAFRESLYRQLTRAHFYNSRRRTAELNEFLKAIKNDPDFLAWLMEVKPNLDSLESALVAFKNREQNWKANPSFIPPNKSVQLDVSGSASPRYQKIVDSISKTEYAEQVSPMGKSTFYEQNVFLLRKGDIVQFGDISFKLGDFLGAGDATHIFAIEGQPDKALRIPFSSILGVQEGTYTTFFRKKLADALKSTERLDAKIKVVRILETDSQYRFQVVERINGVEDGRKYLWSAGKKGPHSYSLPSTEKMKKLIESVMLMPEVASAKEDLKQGMEQGNVDENTWNILAKEARQFLWNEKDWILVDRD